MLIVSMHLEGTYFTIFMVKRCDLRMYFGLHVYLGGGAPEPIWINIY